MMSKEIYKTRHIIISNYQFALEKYNNENWPYFVERIIEISKEISHS